MYRRCWRSARISNTTLWPRILVGLWLNQTTMFCSSVGPAPPNKSYNLDRMLLAETERWDRSLLIASLATPERGHQRLSEDSQFTLQGGGCQCPLSVPLL